MKDLLVAFAATTLSIILTFGTTGVINRIKQKQERKLTALMVMSSIEQFARELDELEEILAHKDSVATWLLSIPIEEVAELGDPLWDPLVDAIGSHFPLPGTKRLMPFSAAVSKPGRIWGSSHSFRMWDTLSPRWT